jgi:hypothetical protein
MALIEKIELTVNVKRKNGTQYSQTVHTEIDPNKLRTLGSISGSNNLKAVKLLFGNQFIGEEIVSYYGYKETFHR